MNILVFSWRDPKHPLAGGAEQVMHEHMKGWIEAGHKVTLFSSKQKNLLGYEIIDKVEIVRRGHQYLGVQIAGFSFYLKNKNKFDLVIDQFHGVPFFTPLYVNKPILAVIQEPARDVWFKNSLSFPANLIIGFLGFIFEPLFFLFYKNIKFMTGSMSAKENVSYYGVPQKNIIVVPHGVIIPKKVTYLDKNRTAITFLGTLSKDKGIEEALKCFSILNKFGKYKFWIIGKADTAVYFSKLQKLTIKLKLKKNIKFWGKVNDEEKFELLSKSLVLINPSVHEGWGLVNIEANFVATPVVAYNSAGLIDSVKNEYSGIIVSKNRPENLAQETNNLLLDVNRYKKLQKTSLLWSKKFDWKSSKLQSLQIINDLYETK